MGRWICGNVAEEDDIAARFAAIVSPIAGSMDWGAEPVSDEAQPVRLNSGDDAAERAARRELRRAERARELAEHQADQAELEATYNSDDDHFRPPEPPPLPRLRPATVGAVLLLALGIALVAVPSLLVIDPQLTMVLGLLLIAGGAITLLSRLRGGDDDSGNGAVL